MKIIRWNFVIPVFVLIALTVTATILFFDTILKSVMISSLQNITGAKVEIADVKTKFLDCSISVTGLKCADKNDYFKNIADVDNITFDMQFTPLLRKKFIIDKMSVTGFKTGTTRKTSGELPKKEEKKKEEKPQEPSAFSKLMDQAKQESVAQYNKLPAVEKFKETEALIKNFDINKFIDKNELSSIKQSRQLLTDMQTKYGDYQNLIANYKIEEKIDNAKKLVSEISETKVSGLKDVANASKKISELKTVKEDFDDILKQLDNIKKDVSSTADITKQIKDSLNQDINSVSSKLSIPDLSIKNISSMLFGRQWVDRVEKALYYINVARQFLPESSDEKETEEVKERLKGRDIIFAQKKYPTLLISNITLSGTTANDSQKGIDFSGVIKNISSHPSMIQQPLTFDIKGSDGTKNIVVDGTFDHRTSKSADVVSFALAGITGAVLNIADNDYMPLINTASAKVSGKFEIQNKDITGKADISFENIKEKNLKEINDSTLKILAEVTNTVKAFSVAAQIQFLQNKDLKLDIKSDIDKKLSDAISKTFSSKVKEVQDKVKSEVTKIVSAQTKEIEKTLEAKKKELLDEIKKQTGSLDDIKGSVNKTISEKSGGITNGFFK